MTGFNALNEMTGFIERIAARTAELTAAKVAEELRADIGQIRDLTNRVHQTVYGDNGDGVLGQMARIRKNCELRRHECQRAMNALRTAAGQASEQASRRVSGPKRTLERWKWTLAGAAGLFAGIVATVEVLYRLHLLR